jgi:O-antigen/teichoic acid export membrane protein
MSERRPEPLRKRVLQGSIYLTIRNGISMLLSLVGSLLVTRAIGPENYGLFAAASGIFGYLTALLSPSVVAYLVREQSSENIEQYHLAFWWLLGLGVAMAVLACGIVFMLSTISEQKTSFVLIAVSLFTCIPIAQISAVPQAILERNLDYRSLALIQVAAQTGTYALAIPLAQLGFGAWALVVGFWTGQAIQAAGYYAKARYRPCWYWSGSEWKRMWRYSFSRSLSAWLYNLRDLAPSLILFPLAGERAVGYYALANRLINMLGFLYSVSGQIAFAAFARLQEDKGRLTKAIQETIQYLILFLGFVLTVFAASVGWVASWVLGAKWDASVIQQLCIVMASRVLLSSVFGVQTQALYVIGQNWLKFKANLAFAVSLIAVSGVLVGVAPLAYAPLVFVLADHIAHIPTYWYDMYGVRKHIGRIDYRLILIWLAATQAAVFAPLIGYWLYIVAIGLLVHPMSIQGARGIVRSLKRDYLERGSA